MFDIDAEIEHLNLEHQKQMTKLRAKAALMVPMLSKVKSLGLSCTVPELDSYWLRAGVKLEITREELPLIREHFGKLEIYSKDVRDADAGTINVFVGMKEQGCKDVLFYYCKTLSVEQKCKIKKVESSYHTLVCEV